MRIVNRHQHYHKTTFHIAFFAILLALIAAIVFYCRTFNGGISQDPSDWSAFATSIGSIGTMLFTALNVWVFFYLTSSIAQYNSQFVLKEKQMECINNFSRTISFIFPISSFDEPTCNINEGNLGKALDWLRNFKSHKDILPILTDESYDRFIERYQEFYLKYRDYSNYYLGNKEAAEQVFKGHQPEEDYYRLYLMARDIKLKMIEDVIDIKW